VFIKHAPNQDYLFLKDFKKSARFNFFTAFIVCDSAELKNKHICPDGSHGLFLTCGGQLHAYILMTVIIITISTR
jgi:hypothetical protein